MVENVLNECMEELDGRLENSLALIGPQEPTDRDFRKDIRLNSVFVSGMVVCQLKYALVFHFLGPEDWDGNPTVEVVKKQDGYEYRDMNWPT